LHLLTAKEGLSRMMKAPFVYGSIQIKIEFGFCRCTVKINLTCIK
jgi:hypothetical protein